MVKATASQPRWFTEALASHHVMGILRGYSVARTLSLAARAWDFGARLVEVPIQSEEAVNTLAVLAARPRPADCWVGAGTVLTVPHVERAKDAGARFVVSPGLDPAVVASAVELGLAVLPGVATASEIQHALGLEMTWMKAFPAGALGPEWFNAMRGPFPDVAFVATGGITADNAAEYLVAGARTLGVGSMFGDEQQLSRLAASWSEPHPVAPGQPVIPGRHLRQ